MSVSYSTENCTESVNNPWALDRGKQNKRISNDFLNFTINVIFCNVPSILYKSEHISPKDFFSTVLDILPITGKL